MRYATLAMTLLTLACSGGQPRPEPFEDDPGAFLRLLGTRAAKVERLTAELSVEFQEEGERVRLKEMIALKAPDQLRVDLLSPFGQPLSTLVSDGETLSIYDQRQRRFFRGAASPAALGRLLPLELAPEELVALMRGGVPVIKHARGEVTWDKEEGRYLLKLESKAGCAEGGCQVIAFEPERKRVTSIKATEAGAVRYSARMGDYQGGEALPHRMRFESGDVQVDVQVERKRINPNLPDAAFQLDAPRGIEVEPL